MACSSYGAAKSGAANLPLGEGVKVRQILDAAISGPQPELWCTAKTRRRNRTEHVGVGPPKNPKPSSIMQFPARRRIRVE